MNLKIEVSGKTREFPRRRQGLIRSRTAIPGFKRELSTWEFTTVLAGTRVRCIPFVSKASFMHVGLLYRKSETGENVKNLIASCLDREFHISPSRGVNASDREQSRAHNQPPANSHASNSPSFPALSEKTVDLHLDRSGIICHRCWKPQQRQIGLLKKVVQ
jgi:hypothetical protein